MDVWNSCCLTKKAEPPPTRGVNRNSGTASGNGGWLRRLVRPTKSHGVFVCDEMLVFGKYFSGCSYIARILLLYKLTICSVINRSE